MPAKARYSAHFSQKRITMATEVFGKKDSSHCGCEYLKLINWITSDYTFHLAAPEDTGAWSEPGGLPGGGPGGYHRRTSGMSERMGLLETNTATSSSTYSRHRNAMLGHPSQG